MADLQELMVPRKRNVKELTAAIAALDSWSPVSATFFTERFGAFNISGTARLSSIIGAFTIAGRSIEQNLKPDKTLQTLAVEAPPALTEDAEEAEDAAVAAAEEAADLDEADAGTGGTVDTEAGEAEAEADLSAVATLSHGDLVRARLEDRAYGTFTVSGVAVWSLVGNMILVGEWILSQEGAPAPRLRHLEIIAPAGTHGHPVPAKITTIADDLES